MAKPNLTDIERKAIIDELLKLSDNGVLPLGVYVKRYAVAVGEGVVGGVWASQIKTKCGRKRKNRDEVMENLAKVPIEDRSVERRVAEAAGISRHLVRRAVSEGITSRKTMFIKPALTSQNKLQRVEHALSFIDDTTLHFDPITNLVHVDEKWFYADRNRRSYLVFDGEELPPRPWKSKRFIPKTMFLAALTRPR
ncbi:hypothetical protein L915_16339 [Phytophthora nicotianae]|uniref:Transposase Tc1-like domain-containing protein n=1 Tax=Phytophthora nicotianae TaxID=4792 RepID=W2I9H5_PHYNI|nr:hypothetical protein L915_16339 [Phytophthora nicotianae]ETL30831.1 hypothetical protein L916_16234 [Phytophthora nicotianae]